MDLNNKGEPFKAFLNSMFLQLNPTIIQKKNIFYMNYYLTNDSSIFRFTVTNETSPNKTTGLSRVEDYSVYKGLERAISKPEDYGNYAKIYIRADNRKIEIKRRYQDFFEFYADNSGALLSLYWILGVIFAYYDRIVTNHSISKKLFYFEGVKDNNFHQFKIFKNLIDSKEQLENNNQIQNPNQIATYARNDTNTNSRGNALRNNYFRRNTNSSLKNPVEEKKYEEKDFIDYSSYNIFEMAASLKICFYQTKKFKNKINLIGQAKEMINDKLDVVFYIRNMILFELINKIYFEDMDIINFLSRPIIYFKKEEGKQDGFNLDDIKLDESFKISNSDEKEVISEEIKEKKNLKKGQGELYKSAYKFDFYILSRRIKNLISNPNKTKNESKLITLLDNQLKGI
jgi:hypothetical protein